MAASATKKKPVELQAEDAELLQLLEHVDAL